MDAAQIARIVALEGNISRYCRLLKTPLTDLERGYIHRRLEEDRLALEAMFALHAVPPSDAGALQAA